MNETTKGGKLLLGYFYLLAAAVIFGCMPLGANIIYADGVTPFALVFLRGALVAPLLVLLTYLKGDTLRISRGAVVEGVLVGAVGCGVTPLLLFLSYTLVDSSTAMVLHFVYPAVVVIGSLFYREKIKKGAVLCVLLCTLGITFFFDGTGRIDPLGAIVALASGVSYAAYVLLLAHAKHKEELKGFRLSFFACISSAALALAVCLVSDTFSLPQTVRGWVVSFIFSVALGAGAVVLFQKGTNIVGGQRAAILSTFEPITGVFVGIMFLNERLTLRTAIGAVVVLSASVLIALQDAKEAKKTTVEEREEV